MDPENPIVRLCVKGMEWEAAGRPDNAARAFMAAWDQSTDEFERCISAHYVARHQEEPSETLRWNRESLDRANMVHDSRVEAFYPSLYLNLGKSYEDLGDRDEAKRFYEMAAAKSGSLSSSSRYGDVVQDAIARGLERVS